MVDDEFTLYSTWYICNMYSTTVFGIWHIHFFLKWADSVKAKHRELSFIAGRFLQYFVSSDWMAEVSRSVSLQPVHGPCDMVAWLVGCPSGHKCVGDGSTKREVYQVVHSEAWPVAMRFGGNPRASKENLLWIRLFLVRCHLWRFGCFLVVWWKLVASTVGFDC